jgi:hypothetical protein
MPSPSTGETIRPEHRPTVEMVRAAFPSGIPEECYPPLLALLCERMSFRAAAVVVSFLTGKDWAIVYNDALGARARAEQGTFEPEALDRTREALRRHGYDRWLTQHM